MDLNKTNLVEYIDNGRIKIKVIPQSGRTELIEENGKLKLYLKAAPEKNKANTELIKYFKKEFKISVRIKAGETSKEKVLEII